MKTTAASGQLGPWAGVAVYLMWMAVALAGAALLVRHRDARPRALCPRPS